MKKFFLLISTAVLALTLTTSLYADLCGQYGVNIKDNVSYDNEHDQTNLFQLFNKYFDSQLGNDKVGSSNELFNKYGVDPTTDWVTNGSSIVGSFKVAKMEHNFSVTSKNGDILGGIYNVSGSVDIDDGNHGIKDLGTESMSLSDGHHIDFNLNANGGGMDYTWSSNGNNLDNALHMIALDITELYNVKNGTDFDSVYMLCWEDLAGDRGYLADWDYQDFVSIVTNINPSATPEPATMLIFGVGLAGAAAARRRIKK